MLKVDTNNKQPAFGSYRIKNNAEKYIAKELHQFVNPDAAKTDFIKNIAEPLKNLSSRVVADRNFIVIEHPVSGRVLEVSADIPKIHSTNKNLVEYKLIDSNSKNTLYTIEYEENQNKIGNPLWDKIHLFGPFLRKHLIALEISKQFEKDLKAFHNCENSIREQAFINKTANKLKDLFG